MRGLIMAAQQQAKVGFEPETLAYQARVLADGGDVIDINTVDNAYKYLKAQGIYNNLVFSVNSQYGIKKRIAGADIFVVKAYNLAGDRIFVLNSNNYADASAVEAQQPKLDGGIIYDGINHDMTMSIFSALIADDSPMTIMVKVKGNYTDRGGFVWAGYVNSQIFGYRSGRLHTFEAPDQLLSAPLTNDVEYFAQYTCNGVAIPNYYHYIDGILVGTSPDDRGFTRRDNWYLGRANSTDRRFAGNLDDVYIFNTQLTQAQMQGILANL